MDKYISIWLDTHGIRTLVSVTDIKLIKKNTQATITIYYKPNGVTGGTCTCGGALQLNESGTMVVGNETDVMWLHNHIKLALESPNPVYELPKRMGGVVDNAGNDIKILSAQIV